MNDLILHIGITKTGSTSLQEFFSLNREKLASLGYGYPAFTMQYQASTDKNGTFILQCCREVSRDGMQEHSSLDKEENMSVLREALKNNEHVLLSEENFCKILPSIGTGDLKLRQQSLYAKLSEILKGLGVRHVAFIVYLRPQWDHFISGWKHSVKIGQESLSLREFCRTERNQFLNEYDTLFDSIERSVEIPHDIIVRRYDRERFENGDIFQDFCLAAGIPWDDGFVIPEKEHNSSITYEAAEAMRPFTEAALAGIPHRRSLMFALAAKLGAEYPEPRGAVPLTSKEINAINRRYEAGNRAVSDKYFNGEPLFFDVPGPTLKPDPKRIEMFRKRYAELYPGFIPEKEPSKPFNSLMHRLRRRVMGSKDN